MKVFKTLTLVFLSSIVLINKIYAQKDYVITLKKDTVFCKIRSHGFINKILQYRANENDKYNNIDSTITEYYTADDSTDYVFKKDRMRKFQGFIARVKKGRIDLYETAGAVSGGSWESARTAARASAGSPTAAASAASVRAGYGPIANTRSFGGANIAGFGTANVGGSTGFFYYASKNNGDIVLVNEEGIVTITGHQDRKKAFLNLFSDDIVLREKFKNYVKGNYNINAIVSCIEEYNKAYASIDSIGSNVWDYIVTKKNDTVKCRLKYDILTNNYLYKVKGKNDYIKIDSTYINGYFYAVDNITFKLITLPEQNKKGFVKWLESGTVNLFERTELVGDTSDRTVKYYWYINKDNDHLIPIKIDADYAYDLRTHKDQLTAFRDVISDDKNLLAEFNENFKDADPNTDNAIRYYVQQYNEKHLKSDKAGR